MRQLLACLRHVAVPTKVVHPHSTPGTAAQQEATAALVAHFREQCHSTNPLPLPSIPEASTSQELQIASHPLLEKVLRCECCIETLKISKDLLALNFGIFTGATAV